MNANQFLPLRRATGELVEGRRLAEVEGKVGSSILRAVAGVDIGTLFGEDV